MGSLSSIANKLNKIKKAIGNNGILKIYVWIKEDSPIRLDLIYKEEVKFVYCNSVKEYAELLKKYKDIEIIEFIGVKKPKPEDVAVA